MKTLGLLLVAVSLNAAALHDAVRAVNTTKVQTLLKTDVDINERDEKGNTPLHYAARVGRLAIIRLLVEQGADVTIENQAGRTPLDIVQSNHYVKSTRLLSKVMEQQLQSADMNLHEAVQRLNQEKTVALLDNGMNINSRDVNGNTPLHIAATTGRLSMIDLLLKRGADVTLENGQGNTPLALAISANHIKAIQHLLKAQRTTSQPEHLPPFHRAAVDNDTLLTKRMMKQGTAVDTLDDEGRTALQVVSRKGMLDMVKFLIANGADVHHVDDQGRDVLYHATFGGDKAIIKLIKQEIEERGSE